MDGSKVLSLIGSKFYKFNDDDLELIRIIGMKNGETVKVLNCDTKEEYTASPESVLENYTALSPDGVVVASIVSVDGGNGMNMSDVIVTLHKTSDLQDNNGVPYCVCRQNVNDIFYDHFNPTAGTVYAGCCVSIDTCPPNIDYRIMTACNGVDKNGSHGVNVYLDDTLDDIIGMIPNMKNYNRALESVYEQYLKNYTHNPLLERVKTLDHKSLHGYCTNLRTLLEENNFMYDFNVCFGITAIGFELEFKDDSNESLSDNCRELLSNVYRTNMVDTYVIPYAKDVDRSEIKMDYLIAKTPSNKMYYIGYTKDGEFVESEKAYEYMQQMHGVALQYSGDKYNK